MSGGVTMPIFPLSNVVLFPRLHCPLRIFEQRYRDMTAYALAGDQRLGMVTVRPEAVDQMSGDPAIYEIGCAGVITEHQRLPDGRYNIVLLGTHRFRVVSEAPRPADRTFRMAETELLAEQDADDDESRLPELRSRVIALASEFISRANPEHGERFAAQNFGGVDDVALVNSLANSFPFGPSEKQQLLEAPGIGTRFEQLADALEYRLAASPVPSPSGPRTLH